MGLYLGFAAYFSVRLCADRARAERVASLLVDRRWPWPPWWAYFGDARKFTKRTRTRKVVGEKGKAFLRDGFVDPGLRQVVMNRARGEDNHASVHLESGQVLLGDDWAEPFETHGLTKADDLPEGANLTSWIDLVHELMATLEVGNAVLPVWSTWTATVSDVSFTRLTVDSRWTGVRSLGPPPEFDLQNSRANYWRYKLGGTYVRHPRWGTYLHRRHLDRIGGLTRLVQAAAPAKVVELGDLVFIQLTEDPEDALTADCERKRRALEAVMAPILVPPRPQETNP